MISQSSSSILPRIIVLLYGYSRGTNLKIGAKVHIAGVGDFFINDISAMDDPCPSPQFKALQEAKKAAETEALNFGKDNNGYAFQISTYDQSNKNHLLMNCVVYHKTNDGKYI